MVIAANKLIKQLQGKSSGGLEKGKSMSGWQISKGLEKVTFEIHDQ